MSDTDKNNTVNVSRDELCIKEGDIVYHIPAHCICEVLSVRPQLNSKPLIYLTKIAGYGSYSDEITQEDLELILPKEQIHYESVTSDNAIKAFYKGKMVLNLEFEFEFKDSITALSYSLSSIKRHYIYDQLLEMYPDTKISRAVGSFRY